MFSFIIPTLNEEKLLPQLLNQIYSPSIKENFEFEVIISDGGSIDKTVSIAEEFGAKIVKKNSTESQNIAIGRNDGAEMAKGEFLIFVNADVVFADLFTFLKTIEAKLKKESVLAITMSVKVFPDEVKFIDRIFYTFYNNYFHFLNFIGLGMGRGECQVVKASVFNKLNGYNNKLAAGEDFDLYKRIRRLGKIYFSRESIVYESPRRYRQEGHFKILFTWLINSLSVIFLNKSHSKKWEQVR